MARRAPVLLAACAVALLAVPAAADHDDAVVLRDVTRVETTRSAVVDVVLHDDATLATRNGVALSGAGRLVGVWLEPRDGGTGFLTSYRLPAFAGGGQTTYGSGPACSAGGALPFGSSCASDGAQAVLPAGRYRMTVLTDGRPLAVTLRLAGLGGRPLTVRPTDLLDSVQKPLPVREQAGGASTTFGDAADLGGPVHTFVVAAAGAQDGSALETASVCRRDDAGTAPQAFSLLCPGGSSGGYQYRAAAGPESLAGAGAFGSSSSAEHRGPVGLGGSFTDSGGVQLRGALGVWLAQD